MPKGRYSGLAYDFCFPYCLRQRNSQSIAPYYIHLGRGECTHCWALYCKFGQGFPELLRSACISHPKGIPVVTSFWPRYQLLNLTPDVYTIVQMLRLFEQTITYWPLYWKVWEGSVGPKGPKGQGSKFMTKWSHMRSKFMGCDSIVNAIRTVRFQKLLLVRLVFNCATDHACVSKSNKVLMLGRTDVFFHFTPESRSPLYRTTKAPRRADIYQKSMCTELSSIIYICFPR
jgi:hypothetical protein